MLTSTDHFRYLDAGFDNFEPSDAYSVTQLLYRGWTKAAIKNILGGPDRDQENPMNRKSPIRLYLIDRVQAAEADGKFKAAKRGPVSPVTRGNMLAAAAKRKSDTLAYASTSAVHVEAMAAEELMSRAIASYNDYRSSRGQVDFTPTGELLKTISINYLLWNASGYKSSLESLNGRASRSKAQQILKKRYELRIVEMYPHLAPAKRKRA